MYYRRKFMLALIEVFGRELEKTNFEKLLFLFCVKFNCTYYDFFPYKYGPFSYVTYSDKRILTKQGYLVDNGNFTLNRNISFLNKIKYQDKINLIYFKKQYSYLKGKQLIKEIYKKFPYFASKSEIIKDIFSDNEYDEIYKKATNYKKQTESILFTLGYEGLTIDKYLNKLIENNISLVIDVRKNPRSMKFDFNQNKLKQYLSSVNIDYLHLPDLGINSNFRKNLHSVEDYENLLQFYKNTILIENKKSLNIIYEKLNKFSRVSLLCFEKQYNMCHRSKIAEYFEKKKHIKIHHLI